MQDLPRCGVIGGCGYVGKLLSYVLHARGYPTVILDLPPPGSSPPSSVTLSPRDIDLTSTSHTEPVVVSVIGSSAKGNSFDNSTFNDPVLPSVEIPFIAVDIITSKSLDVALSGFERIYHLASPDPLQKNKTLFDRINIEGTKNIIAACQRNNIHELIYCSSASVVFHDFDIQGGKENLEYQYHDTAEPYNASKAKAEELVLAASGDGSALRTIALRPHAIFGHNGFGKLGIMDPMLSAIKEGKSKFYIGTGNTLSDFTHVQTLVDALVLSGEVLGGQKASPSNCDVSKKAYFITNDEPVWMWSFFSNFAGELGFPRPRLGLPFRLMLGVGKLCETFMGSKATFNTQTVRLLGYHHWYSVDRAKHELGFKPSVSFHQGFSSAVKYIKHSDADIKARFNMSASNSALANKKKAAAVQPSLPHVFILGILCFLLACLSGFVSFCSLYNNELIHLPFLAGCGAAFFLALLSFYLYLECTSGTVLSMKSGIPLVGDFLAITKGPLSLLTKLSRECRGAVSLSFFGKRIVFLSGNDGLEFFFKASDVQVSMKEVYNIVSPIFGKGIIYNTDLNRRQQQMYFLAQGLSDKNMLTYLPTILSECELYFSKWDDEGICESIHDTFSELISLTAAHCLMGHEIRQHVWEDMSAYLHDLDEGITLIGNLSPNFPIKAHRRRDAARRAMVNIFSKIIRKRRLIMQSDKISSSSTSGTMDDNSSQGSPDDISPIQHTKKCDLAETKHSNFDVLTILLNAKYRDGTPFTDDEICGLLIVLMFAGQHTSSISSTWLFINLLIHKDIVLADILDEQNVILLLYIELLLLPSPAMGEISFKGIMKESEFLSAAFIESLRLHNPLGILARYVTSPLEWKGHHFLPGTILGVCTHAAGKDPDIFENPYTYNPQRWLNEDWENWRKQYKFVQFGAGRHSCMGRRFALLQIKTIMSYFLRNFVCTPLSPKPETDESAMVVGPKSPFRVHYRRLKTGESLKAAWKVV
ncbi:putative lanosterol 14-alpha demethylase [Cardiosporidium cionae]|uniref:Lanosterol 14-alpha demethylase n=1 Tax=Cardiosporidium cionae TaxID=476202 RepID=A0ABQ7J991_9APIC|nr:putative lanosterol 14-alpha demethylase [Cardiosporidium cionae]|eukprot:KAF8820568.1 putative lanosterol 14-alpha demethylase [Cardiosporidium cionae]